MLEGMNAENIREEEDEGTLMNIVDSSGWVEYLTKGANGPVFLPIVQDTQNLLVPTITIYEVFRRVLQEMDAETALQITGVMSLGKEVGTGPRDCHRGR